MSAVTLEPPAIGERACRAASMFGLAVDRDDLGRDAIFARLEREAGWAALTIDTLLEPGRVALVTGPSGSGKSTVLRTLARGTTGRVVTLDDARARLAGSDPCAPIVNLFSLPLDETLRVLGRAGLSEAPLLARPASALSEGERFRLLLGMMLDTSAQPEKDAASVLAGPPSGVLLIIDEFVSSLDGVTAAGVSHAVRRMVSARPGMRAVLAGAREELVDLVQPDLMCVMRGHGRAEVYVR